MQAMCDYLFNLTPVIILIPIDSTVVCFLLILLSRYDRPIIPNTTTALFYNCTNIHDCIILHN